MSKNQPEPLQEKFLPGTKPVCELLRSEPQRISKVFIRKNLHNINDITSLCQKNGIACELVDNAFLDSLCGKDAHVAHQGIIAQICQANIIELPTLLSSITAAPLPLILALDQVQDPGNVGAICRTAYALGCAGMILPKHNSANLGPAAFKSSAGALQKMPIAIVTNLARALDEADERGVMIYGTGCATNAQNNAFACQWQLPAILVLGGENKGIRPGVAKRCGIILTIPFARQFDSLNIAQAGAILLGLCYQQKGKIFN